MLGDCFVDCVTCLLAFANNKISSRSSLKAIALLRICEDRLADVRRWVLFSLCSSAVVVDGFLLLGSSGFQST